MMESGSEDSTTDPAKEKVPLWSSGEPLRYPVPKEDGDLWDKLLKPLLERDKEQCHAWKEEVENLLIFAGLFSAVVTAFVVESYKGLQPDPNDAIISLLSRIATSIDGPQNGTQSIAGVPTQAQLLTGPGQHPSAAVFRYNALWFISLVLSLTTALVGTVGLQWLREHQRYPIQDTSRSKFAVFNMRREGLDDWYVPQIFSALPMLLQLSLALFLVGLIDFLVSLAPPKVFAPVIGFIGLPAIFVLFTTTVPSFQWIIPPAIHIRLLNKVPSQCPYKSPQSYALAVILAPMLRLVIRVFAFLIRNSLSMTLTDTYYKISLWEHNSWALRFQNALPYDQLALQYRERCCHEQYRLKWIAEGPWDLMTVSRFLPKRWVDEVPPVYDCLGGLKFAVAEGNYQPHVKAAASHHCAHDLTTLKQDIFGELGPWYLYIQNMIGMRFKSHQLHVSLASHYPDDADAPGVLLDELSAGLRHIILTNSPESFAQFHEAYIRLMKYYLSKPIPGDDILRESDKRKRAHPKLVKWYVPVYCDSQWDVPPDISEQYTILLEQLLISSTTTALSGRTLSDLLNVETICETLPPQYILEFLLTACRSQDSSGQLRLLKVIQKLIRKHFPPELSRVNPQDPLLLLVLMTYYVGDIYTRTTAFDSYYNPEPYSPPTDVSLAAASLVIPLARCLNSTGIDQLPRPPIERWKEGYCYSLFVDFCDKSWKARFTGHTSGLARQTQHTLLDIYCPLKRLESGRERSTSDKILEERHDGSVQENSTK